MKLLGAAFVLVLTHQPLVLGQMRAAGAGRAAPAAVLGIAGLVPGPAPSLRSDIVLSPVSPSFSVPIIPIPARIPSLISPALAVQRTPALALQEAAVAAPAVLRGAALPANAVEAPVLDAQAAPRAAVAGRGKAPSGVFEGLRGLSGGDGAETSRRLNRIVENSRGEDSGTDRTPVPGRYGGRSRVAALNRAMERALGKPSASRAPLWVRSDPLLNRLWSFIAPGGRTRELGGRLDGFVAAQERRWNRPVTELAAAALKDYDVFRAQKAGALVRFGRRPDEVTEGFLTADGSVDGQPIAPRRLFWQHWAPVATPSGKLILVSPGFQESGRHFYEQIDALNRAGHEVVAVDQPWTGYSDGAPGGIDRGYGVARDVAAAAAWAAERYPGRRLILMGHSMGAGPGVFGALALGDAGRIALKGAPMPQGLSAVLQAPYFTWTPTWTNRLLDLLSRVPLLRRLALFSMSLPIVTDIQAIKLKLAELALQEDVRAQPASFRAALADIKAFLALAKSGATPRGRVVLIQSAADPLAYHAASREALAPLGARARVRLMPAPTHTLDDSTEHLGFVLEAVDWLGAPGRLEPLKVAAEAESD